MISSSIANLAQETKLLGRIFDTQKQILDTQNQISTQKVAVRYSEIASQSDRLVNLKTSQERIDRFSQNNQQVIQRLRTMELHTSQIFDIASDFRILLISALNTDQNASNIAINAEATNRLEMTSGLLNVDVEGRYLFSGMRTGTPPVDLNDPNFLTPPIGYPSSADITYYQGDSAILSAHADDDLDVSYGVRADAPGFEKLIRALHIVQTTTTSPLDRPRLEEALRLAGEAVNEIPNIRTGIGGSIKTLDLANQIHIDALLQTQESVNGIENVDIAAAMTKLSNDQLHLEASFMVLARLSSLSLLNFLR